MPPPRISIVTPSFRQLRFLRACVASVEMQAYPDVEHLVMDGGSDDGTREYLEKSPGCVSWWRSHPDRGQSAALTEGFSRASGDWIGWQNSDDVYLHGAFWSLAHALERHPGIGVFVGDTSIINEGGLPLFRVGVCPVPARKWLLGNWPYNQAVFFRRDILLKAGPVDESFHIHMDTDLLARIALLEPKVAYVPWALGGFRKYAGTKTESPQLVERIRIERQMLLARYGAQTWPKSGLEGLAHRISHHLWTIRAWGFGAFIKRIGGRLERHRENEFAVL